MRKVYVRELKPYSLAGLADEFECSSSQVRVVVGELMLRGLVKHRTTRKSDLDKDDLEDAGFGEKYQFHFVGLIMLRDMLIISYPKYFRDGTPTDDELRLVLQVLKRDAGIAAVTNLEDGGDVVNDRLSVMLALLELYGEYGEYSNYIEGRELNGCGGIDWNRTISGHLPILSDGCPIYTDYETRKTLRDGSDFITRLHRAVLTECSREFCETGVDKLLSLDGVWLSDEGVDGFGDVEMLKWRLEREYTTQFIDWKLRVLDLLERYLFVRENEVRNEEIFTLGTMSFYNLWEKACKVAFGDGLDKRLGGLGIVLEGEWAERGRETLLGIIPRPQWERWGADGFSNPEGADTLIPDAIALVDGRNDERLFCIYDAKYYVPSADGKMRHQPGLESVSKQFLYQSAYRGFVKTHAFDRVVNAFLVPGTINEPELMARVSFPGVIPEEEPPIGSYVYMWALPADAVFEAYLHGEMLPGVIDRIVNVAKVEI